MNKRDTFVIILGVTLYLVGALGLAFMGAVVGGILAVALGASGAAEPALMVGGAGLALALGAAWRWLGPERFVGRYLHDAR